ncbi:MAG: bZIP transcription factor [Candidatus Sulfotelmatobacter sp.]
MNSPWTFALRLTAVTIAALVLLTVSSQAQDSGAASASPPADAAVRELDSQVRELRAMIEQMRAENAQSRAEMRELRQELQDTRKLLTPLTSAMNNSAPATEAAAAETSTTFASVPQTISTTSTPADVGSRLQKLEESTQLLGSKIDEQYQTKVETAAKYRARLSGIVLMNAFRNVGASDNLDLPDYAQPLAPGATSEASFGATLRQTEIGLEIFGPTLAGARTSANVQFDFAGGFPATPNGVNFGIVRMQTASLRLDWKNTSVIAGQDSLFISPLSPTSFASLAIPALAYAGNLWGWTPQLRVEHRFNLPDDQTVTLQGGILDNLDWENPSNPYTRSATAGEQTGQPAYALRSAWSRPVFGHPLSVGVAGYYGRQNWSWDRNVDAWAGMTDWQIPIVRRLNLSGEFYRGRAVGGLGAAIGQTILYGGNPYNPYTSIHGLDSAGGWSQLKFQLTPKLELNGVLAEDNAFASDVRGFATDANNFGPILGRNRGALGNLVYRPRSDLLLSAEFRRLHTFPVYDLSSVTNQVNLAMGILF